MSVSLENERVVPCYEYDIENLSKEEAQQLRAIGLREIQKDDTALIAYGVNYTLQKMIGEVSGDIDRMKKILDAKIKNKKKD